jgi:hypothetical protein
MLLFIFGFITYGLYLMEIENHYGDDTLDLYELIYLNGVENKYEVFISKNVSKIKELTSDKIVNIIEKKKKKKNDRNR